MFGPSNTNQTPPRLSLTFFVGAFLALLVAYLLLAGTAHEVLRYYLMPDTIALAHVTVLGWIALAIMGALYQLTPVLIQAPIVSVRLAWVQLVTFVLGVAWFVESLAMARGTTLPFAAALTVVGVLLFLVNIGLSLRRITAWSVPARYLAVALSFFTLAVSLGLLFALDLRYGWFPIPAHLLAVHVHLGVVGFFGLTLLGVSYRLFAMFALVRGHDERLANINLGLLSGSLVALAVCLLFAAPTALTFAAALGLAAGFSLYVWDVGRMFRLRMKRRFDLYIGHIAASLACLIVLIPMGVLTVTGWPQRMVGETPWLLAYAYVALGGWLTFAIAGHAYKIVPMLVWQQRYRSRPTSGRPPLLHEMYSHRLAVTTLALYGAGFLGTLGGLLTGEPHVVRYTALVAGAGAVTLLVNVVGVLAGRGDRAAAPARPPLVFPAGGKDLR